MSRRQTVISKKGKAYKYRQVDPTSKRIRVNTGYGYDEGSMTKLAFKNGKLTKAGEIFRDSINEIPNKQERNATLAEFDKYVAQRSRANKNTTLASFQSHMLDESYDRLLNNLNVDKNEVTKKIMKKYGNKVSVKDEYGNIFEIDAEDVVNDYFLFNQLIEFSYEEGWDVK